MVAQPEPRPPAPRTHTSFQSTSTSASEPTPGGDAPPRRLFLHEPGWAVALKAGSDRAFCYMMAPGQDYYHRLLDGELYVVHGDERLCLACATRRGLLSFEPRGLKPSAGPIALEVEPDPDDDVFDLKPRDDDPAN